MRPSIFYKYTSPATTLAVLSTRTLRWSSPKLFNDPLELQRFARFVPGAVESIHIYMETLIRAAAGEVALDESRLTAHSVQLLQMFRRMTAAGVSAQQIISKLSKAPSDGDAWIEEGMRKFLDHDNARILCLSETPTNNAMWGNYAANATGCVLGLRSVDDSAWLEAKQVRYLDELPPLGSGLDYHLYGQTPEMLKASVEAACYTKLEDWKYEREWRIVTWARPHEVESGALYKDYAFGADELESVTFGARIESKVEVHVRSLVRTFYPDCRLYRIAVERGETMRIAVD